MSIDIRPPQVDELKPRIAVIGVGGAGGNAIANMIANTVEGVDFIVANTDAQALNASPADRRIQLGPEITQGLGAGSRPEVGRAAAEETMAVIEQALEGAHMCFIAAGMGGGTGTGAAPVIAKIARDKGILTVGVVTKPFTFEGSRRMRSADAGIDELQKTVDTLIVIPNQNLFLVANPNTTFKEAFSMADEVLQQGVRGITDLMVMPGLINLDFADVRSVMHEMGKAMMGTGEAEGDGRALEAAEKAIANPLLDGVSMRGAKGVIISITGGEDMRLMEVDEAANHIRELVDPDANIIWGSAFNEALEGKIRVSVVATGIDADAVQQPAGGAPASRAFAFPSRKTPAAAAPRPADTASPAPSAYGYPVAGASHPAQGQPVQGQPVSGQSSPEQSPLVQPGMGHAQGEGAQRPPLGGTPTTFGGSTPFRSPDRGAAPPPSMDRGGQPHYNEHAYGAQAGFPAATDVGGDPFVAEAAASGNQGDEFVLGADMAETPRPGFGAPGHDDLVLGAPSEANPVPGHGSGPDRGEPAPGGLKVGFGSGQGGGTLFERMSNLSRGAVRKDAADQTGKEEERSDIPRFLNRQNNQ